MSDEHSLRCQSCGVVVRDMDLLVDHISNSHDIIDVVVNGIADSYEVVSDE